MKRLCLLIIVTLSLGLIAATCAWSGTVTLDAVGKSVSSDVNTLDAKAPRVVGDQVGVYVGSKLMQPQNFTLKITGLKDEDYDIYVSGSYVGKKSAKELLSGIELSIPGTIGHPDLMRCLNALKDKIKPEIERISKMQESEPQRVLWTLRQADDWVRSGIRSDETYRSIDIIAAPTGSVLSTMTWRSRQDAEGTAAAITRACWLLQQARARMYSVIKDPDLRNSAVATMTPVTFSASYLTANGKPQVTAKIVNDCNLPISGTITYTLPKGWKTDAKPLTFKNLGAGKAYQATLKLIAPSKGAVAPASVPIAATVRIAQDKYEAKFTLRTNAAVAFAPAHKTSPAK
ncbi:MAG: NEW3 domain-containing protein [Armatimonadota bacterium]